MAIELKVDTRELGREIKRLGSRAQNMAGVNQQLAEMLRLAVEDKFEDKGPGWPALSDLTLRLRRQSKTPAPLQDSGVLVGSLTSYADAEFAEVYTNVEYAKFHVSSAFGGVNDGSINLKPLKHQQGTWPMPQRDFFAIDMEKMLERMARVVTEEIARGR